MNSSAVQLLHAVGGIENVRVDKKSLLLSVSAARQRYLTHLEDQKRTNKEKERRENQLKMKLTS
jgi:protein subunit release factor B